jgi:hypothetical protein
MLTQLLSSEAGIPASYLGFATDNPPSADAIRALESRLVRRAELRQKQFGAAWTQVARLSFMVREGKKADDLPPDLLRVRPKWRDAATPTLAAQTDSAVKLVAAKVLPEQSQVTWDMVGIPREAQRQLEADLRRQSVRDLMNRISTPGQPGQQPAHGEHITARGNVSQQPQQAP